MARSGAGDGYRMRIAHTQGRLEIRRLVSTHLLFDLQLVHDGSQLGQNLVGFLVVFELGGDEVGEVAEGLGGVEDLVVKLAFALCAMFGNIDWVLTFFMTPTASSV